MPGDETLLDVGKKSQNANISNKPSVSANLANNIEPITPMDGSLSKVPSEKKSKKWIWIIITVLIVAGGGYLWYWKYYISQGKSIITEQEISKYNKGPNLNITISGVLEQFDSTFRYSPGMDAILYQKDGNQKILGDFFSLNQKAFNVIETYGANIISLSNDGKYVVIYYPEDPKINDADSSDVKAVKQKLVNANHNYYIVNIEDNKSYNLGMDLSNFIWNDNNLYFIKNGTELWTYDIKLANYNPPVYQGPIEPLYKIIDITHSFNSMTTRPNSSFLYFIETPPNELDKTFIYSFDPGQKKFNKIFEVKSNYFCFSPSGSMMIVNNVNENSMSIYDANKNIKIQDVPVSELAPNRIVWSSDEKYIYYFTQNSNYLSAIKSNNKTSLGQINTIGFYSDLNKYSLDSKSSAVIVKGKDINLADPVFYAINGNNSKIYIKTNQINNIYEVNLK